MHRHDARDHLFAIALAMLAGFVDALGFLRFGGLFVSFMSGNSTRFAVALGSGSPVVAVAMVILAFVVGVTIGALVAAAAARRRAPAVLALVAALLLAASMLATLGIDRPVPAVVALAMGAVNNVFQRDGAVSIGVTYMTGTLVKLGQQVAGALMGGARWGWLPYLLLWLGLVAGAVAGAMLFPRVGLAALWIATGFAALLLAVAARRGAAVSAPRP